ncbi:hypothetical protein ACFQ2B_12985 [Streptomyces stramineus]
MAVKEQFDLLGRDVLALADDDVLGPAGEDEVASGGEVAEIAGAEEPVGVERLGGPVGVEVAAADGLAAQPDVPVRAGRDR